ncbi:MAG TPA: hypothetical protein DHU55_09100 [Blastocatellia bacterium]|nr:hypothetical protein [Blastocatellia bacterium]
MLWAYAQYFRNFELTQAPFLLNGNVSATIEGMPLVANKSKGKKAGAVIADATDRLLRATKKKILRGKGKIDYGQLAEEGYSRDLIARLKAL